jgi:hypothetical protein
MKSIFDWMDNATFSIAGGLVIAVVVLFSIFAWDIVKAYRKYKDGKK